MVIDESTPCECGHIADEHEVNPRTGQPEDCTVCDGVESMCGGFDPAEVDDAAQG